MSEVNVGYSRTHRLRIGSDVGAAVVVSVGVKLAVIVVSGVLRAGVVTGADVVGTVVVDTAVEPPDGPDESVHPAARRTAMARSAREKSMPVLIVHRLYHDPIIFLFSFPRVPPLPSVFIRGGREIQKDSNSLNRHAVQG